MRGRKPKPTFLRVLDGNASHRPINGEEPKPAGDLLEPPDWMSESQKDSWRYAIRSAPTGLLKHLDRSVLSVWVVAEDLHRFAAMKVSGRPLVRAGENGAWMQNPYLPIQNKQAAIMLKAASEMGFTPSSRTRVRVERVEADSTFADLKRFDG